MSGDFERLAEILGPSPWPGKRDLSAVEQEWRVSLPAELHMIAGAYGDVMIDGFMFIYGPLVIREKGDWMRNYVKRGESRLIVDPVLPEPGGMLACGHTVEGDRLFLVPRDDGRQWTVSAFRRNWGDWHDSELPLDSWLLGVFRGDIEADWFPEWPSRHTFEN